jgi:hypothetical protein
VIARPFKAARAKVVNRELLPCSSREFIPVRQDPRLRAERLAAYVAVAATARPVPHVRPSLLLLIGTQVAEAVGIKELLLPDAQLVLVDVAEDAWVRADVTHKPKGRRKPWVVPTHVKSDGDSDRVSLRALRISDVDAAILRDLAQHRVDALACLLLVGVRFAAALATCPGYVHMLGIGRVLG